MQDDSFAIHIKSNKYTFIIFLYLDFFSIWTIKSRKTIGKWWFNKLNEMPWHPQSTLVSWMDSLLWHSRLIFLELTESGKRHKSLGFCGLWTESLGGCHYSQSITVSDKSKASIWALIQMFKTHKDLLWSAYFEASWENICRIF